MSLEVVLYILIQVIEIVGKLEELNIYSYLELTPKDLMVDTQIYEIRINSDLS